jgi:hypothetical protein
VAWLLGAAAMQAISMTAFALQQKALLAALGVRIGVGRAEAVTLARSAISISMPAGAAVSAAYALRHYRRAGASNEVAAATMVVSGLVSIGGLAALYIAGVVGTVARNPMSLWNEPPAALAVTSAVLALMLAGLVAVGIASYRRRKYGRRPFQEVENTSSGGRLSRYAASAWSTARNAWRAGGTLRMRHWIIALAYAAANWLTDLLCLAACTRALGLPIGITTLASLYLVVQIVRQVPITPGGVGLIETAFIAGLTAAGTSAASATAAVLLYRVLSCWIIIPIGGLAGLLLNRVPEASTGRLDEFDVVVQGQNRDVVTRRFGRERQRGRAQASRDDVRVVAGQRRQRRVRPLDAEEIGAVAPLGHAVGEEHQRVPRLHGDVHAGHGDGIQQAKR